MKLNLLYVHSTAIGYARYGSKLAGALTRMGVQVFDELDPDTKNICNTTCLISTPSHARGWFEGQRPIVSTMWEATVLPEAFREGLHNFAQVIVPSEQNLELFSRYHDNVVKVPLGIDSREWHYRPRKPPTDRFVFLIGGSGARKGTDVAYKAFKKLWPTEGSWGRDNPRPHLIFKSPRNIDYYGDRIEHVGGKLDDLAERDLYGMAHCYLQPSRGEGFGLQPLQAIAQGLPTILTNAHGHAEFAHLGYGIGYTMEKADYFIFGDAGQWWEPKLDDLCEYMEYVYKNYDEACDFAKQASDVAHMQFSWENCAEAFVDAIGPEHLGDYTGSGRWTTPEMKLYAVKLNRDWRADIGGRIYQFVKGETTYEPADVKRVLFEAGLLDPDCVVADPTGPLAETETGLTKTQAARIGAYSASHRHCLSCGQLLNEGTRYEPEFADQ